MVPTFLLSLYDSAKIWLCKVSLPIFQPTSSPTLDALLESLRQTIFIPASLFRPQKHLVYRKSRQHILLNPDEPVTITLSTGEPHTLRPLDHLTDEPNAKKSFHEVLDLMKEGKDFDTLPGILEGYRLAKRNVTDAMKEKMIRKCTQAGKGGLIMKCIQEVEKTGFKLDSLSVARCVMLISVYRAIESERSQEGLEKASKFAESILNMLDDPQHVVSTGTPKNLDPRIHPDILGVVLSTFATRAVRFQSAQDHDGKVAKYAERMLSLWPNADFSLYKTGWHSAHIQLLRWTPTWHGMNMALRVLNSKSESGRRLNDALRKDVQPLVEKARDILLAYVPAEGGQRLGMKMYSDLAATL